MTDNLEVDNAETQALARKLGAHLEAQLIEGADPTLLAIATVGLGAELLRQSQSIEMASKTLTQTAQHLIDIDRDLNVTLLN